MKEDHNEMLRRDLIMHGVAYEIRLLDGTLERIDPTTIRVIKLEDKPELLGKLTGEPPK